MATWQQGINSGGFLGGIGQVNTNAPQASDVNATLGLIRQNNEFARAGGNNVGLQALQGLQGLSDAYKQDQLQKAQASFNQAHANAWKTGDTSALRDFAVQNPAFVAQAQQAVSGLDKSQLSDMTNQAAKLRLALSQGPDAYAQYLQKNAGELSRVGANPAVLAQMGAQNPQGAAQLFDTLGMAGSGDKYFDILNKQQEREIDRGKLGVERDRLIETARNNDMENARGWANVNNAALDRAQRAQFHSDNVGLKLQELSAKQAELGKIDPKLVRDLNSDINGYSKNYSAMRSAAENLQALGKRNTPASQLGMIFNYMKSLDPQSVVREGEQVQVKKTDGIYGTLGNYISQLSSGKMLNNDQVADLINTSKLMANTEGSKFNQQMDEYLTSYGNALPSGLVNQLQSRKAKLFDDVPGTQASSGGGAIQAGHSEGGYTFLGGDPGNPNSWRKN
ncbi:phage DNA ejection protein [Symbiopectobacterium purcellii]|uniref:DNA transfer protein n=1 Tax=Symbiopectobacterium purcellii TaxID=2871826 RepID=A0ABX9AHE0_9ENTR|nr:phage DNA ejection protein [Symbiopectobacterium purcellii]QZN94109.1 DNA transfer protein [Symbiopectobacterium purcellii]